MLDKKRFVLIYFYFLELGYRIGYILTSFTICLIIAFQNIELLLLVETYPFLELSHKKFIVTQTTDLINSIWLLVFSNSFFVVFPMFFYQIIGFSKTGWYCYQLDFSIKILIFPLVICYVSVFFCYFKIFPVILNFLTHWNLDQIKVFLSLEIEFRILNYLHWILLLRYCFSFLTYIFVMLIIQINYLVFSQNIYAIIKYHRKKICFSTILVLFILAPPDIFLQFFIIFITFVIYEFIFFILCYKTCSLKI